MAILLRLLKYLLPILLGLALLCASLPLRSLADYLQGNSYGGGSGEGGSCAMAGQPQPDNPYTSWPIPGGSWGMMTASYCDPLYMQQFGIAHWGIDLGYPMGTEVISAGPSIVERAEYDHPSMGNNIRTCSTSGWCAIYMHLSTLSVIEGDEAPTGILLGTVGSTGNSTGPHLHFEVKNPAGETVDPATALP